MQSPIETAQPDFRSLSEILKNDNLCLSRNPRGTDKGEMKSYIEKFYEKNFKIFRDRPVHLMEIGFRHGASLALWSKYFRNGNILGADNFSDIAVDEKLPVVDEWINRPNVKITVGDAYSRAFANSIAQDLDIVIDDGPHTLKTQRISLELYLPKLNPGGIFVIEDILSGGLAIFPLMVKVPLGFSVHFYDFRWHRLCGDNCLFVARENGNALASIGSRLGLCVRGALYLLAEGPLRLLKKLLNIRVGQKST